MHHALPFNLAVGRAQSHRLKMNVVANIAGRIGHFGEVVLVTGGGDKAAIAEDNLFSLIGVELLAFFTIETSKRFSIQKMGCFRSKCRINKQIKPSSSDQDAEPLSACHDNLLLIAGRKAMITVSSTHRKQTLVTRLKTPEYGQERTPFVDDPRITLLVSLGYYCLRTG